MSQVTVEIKSQNGISNGPAEITVKDKSGVIAMIIAEVKYMKGVDGGMHPRVELTKKTTRE